MEYRTLEHTAPGTLLEAFNAAFSDYAVPMNMTPESLDRVLVGRGYRAELSVGAFEDGRLVGFVLNALRDYGGLPTAYDTGTGILPGHRGAGVGKAMMAHALPVLRAAGARRYLLEVIQGNTPAVELYSRQGFVVLRELLCFETAGPLAATPEIQGIRLLPVLPEGLWPQAEALWDIEPSWQNSRQSVSALAHRCACALIEDAAGLVGYAIMDMSSGSVAQLAVRPSARRRGLGSALLARLAQGCAADKLSAINVDAASPGSIAFLQALGFSQFIGQLEMALSL